MARPTARMRSLALAFALVFALALPLPSAAIAPALLALVQQLAQQAATSMIKDALLSGLAGMGCKGIALSNALAGFDRRSLAGGGPRMGMTDLAKMRDAVPPEMMAKMQSMLPGAGQLPPGVELPPGFGQTLSVPETLATIDALFELGFMPAAAQSEFKQCMLLLPETIPTLGMAMGMMQPMIPQLRQARDELRSLAPAEQDEVAAALAAEVRALPADQREALLEHIGSGFFPPRVAEGVKARLAGR